MTDRISVKLINKIWKHSEKYKPRVLMIMGNIISQENYQEIDY